MFRDLLMKFTKIHNSLSSFIFQRSGLKSISNTFSPPQNQAPHNSRCSLKASKYCHNLEKKDTF